MGTLRNEYVRCGKASCKACPHGPYWYEYFRLALGPKRWRTWKRYIGKEDPRVEKDNDPDEAVWEDTSESIELAYHLVGARPGMNRDEVKRCYVQVKMRLDPCRAADIVKLQRLEHAWALIRRANHWK